EMCIWVTSDPFSPEDAICSLESRPILGNWLDRGQMEVVHFDEWYLDGGSFRGKKVLRRWSKRYKDAISGGYAGLRISGDMSWVDAHTWKSFAEYEGRIDRTIDGKRMLALCTYPLDFCERTQVDDVVGNHNTTIWEGAEGWNRSTGGRGRIVAEVMGRKRLMRGLMSMPSSQVFVERFEHTSKKISEGLSMGEEWKLRRAFCLMNDEIGREIEDQTGLRLSSLSRDRQDLEGLIYAFSRVHAAALGARGIDVDAGERYFTISVAGCSRSGSCGITDGSSLGCLPDHLVSAILQALTDTPVGLRVGRENGACTRRFSPAWLVELLPVLGELGARSFVVLYGDRVVHYNIFSEEDGEVLSRAVLKNDEGDRSDRDPQLLSFGGVDAVMYGNGRLFVAATFLEPVRPLEFARSLTRAMDEL
ncbi:MAG: MEDS domain-containing protein, partial [Theionarchaea archaeon]|nr:MEDS domain-containing protein [Theionarchaea archaeon]